MEYVDLGLPSGTLWAKCNLGAEHEWETGKYYQWGATEGYYPGQGAEEHSSWETRPFQLGVIKNGFDEFQSLLRHICPHGVLPKKYDAAFQATNGQAHIPTKGAFNELLRHTVHTQTIIHGVNGVQFISHNGHWIFIPQSGYAAYGSFQPQNQFIYLHLASLDDMQQYSYAAIAANTLDCSKAFHMIHNYAFPIRCVQSKTS